MKKSLLFAAGFALAAMPMAAQKLATGYITMPASEQLHTYIQQWNGGTGTIMMDGQAWEDEEFFISRVKPKARFYNVKTQVREDLTQYSSSNTNGTDKRYLNWVPINDPEFNAIPNGIWDQDVFSMWSYVDHYGDWTAPYGWAPGAFADVAHKNGVAVSGVASVPNSSIPTGWSSCFEGVISQGSDAVAKWLYYHGVDGLGYNSEWSAWSPTAKGLTALHSELETYMKTRNPLFENIWYGGTTDGGSIAFDSGTSNSQELYKNASLFLNYNWNNTSTMSNSISYSKSIGKSPFYIYAGMNQQGGEPKSGSNYDLLKNYQYSIGIWGAHSRNMFWEGRGSSGTTVEATQAYMQDTYEAWYTGGSHNPAIRQEIKTVRDHRPRADWAGISSMVSARSSLSWNLNDEPFYSFFNVGNGKFFNWKGERLSDKEWYSIGIQDYMPTWRWWFAPTFMGKDVAAGSVSLAAAITWDDAYVGGSCLKVTGTSAKEYLHLFKTNYSVTSATKIRLIYKLLGGKADVKFALTNASAAREINPTGSILTVDGCPAIEDASYAEAAAGWQVAEFNLPSARNTLNGNLSLIALSFENAENLEMLIGGLEVVSKEDFGAPATPQVVSSKVLSNSFTGVDGKIIWKMGTPVPGEPKYNSDADVNASMYHVYAREEGGEPQFLGATTSWAAIGFRAPNTDASKKIQYGVKAISLDTKSESEIVWGDLFDKGSYKPAEEIEISKSIIKPGESFEVRFVDQNHASDAWTIINTDGQTVASGNGTKLEVPQGLEVGLYDLHLGTGSSERVFASYVQITGEESGALPEIYTLTRDENDVTSGGDAVSIDITDTPTLAYTGRKADGVTSRALALASRYIGCKISDIKTRGTTESIGGTNTSISVAGWFKFNTIPDKKWNFMNISNKAASWPQNTWGWAWNAGYSDGSIECVFRGASSDSGNPGELHYGFPNTYLQPGVWTHIAWICEYSDQGFRCFLYINGVKQESRWHQLATGNDVSKGARTANGETYSWTSYSGDNQAMGTRLGNRTTDQYCSGQTYAYSANDRIYFGGAAHEGASIDGLVDDFQIWDKAMTEEEVKLSMSGITKDNMPDGLYALWDFESAPGSDNKFTGFGYDSEINAYSYNYEGDPQNGGLSETVYAPSMYPGCPFLPGTAYPIETKATWKDKADRKTQFTPIVSRAATEGEAGSATVKFNFTGDHNVSLTLENNHGSATKDFPVFSVSDNTQGIGDIAADGGEMNAYTVDNVLFLEFAQDGAYEVEVYNAAGMLVGAKKLNVVAGQNARITLGAKGVYLVKASANGQALRTVKVLSK